MPRVTLKTGFTGPDGREEELSEYLCDAPGCANVATHVVGCIRDLGLCLITCAAHAPATRTANQPNTDT